MTAEQRSIKDAIIRFVVKDKTKMNQSNYIGEAFMSFSELEDCTNKSTKSCKHFVLPLTLMSDKGEQKKQQKDRISISNFFIKEPPSIKYIRERSKFGDEKASNFWKNKKPLIRINNHRFDP